MKNLFLLLLLPAQLVLATSHRIHSRADLAALQETLGPGDVVVLANGTYTNQHFVFRAEGTKEEPITLRAETPGEVVLNGSSKLSIGGSFLIVDGLFFHKGSLKSGAVVEFRGAPKPLARHCTLRNTAIIDYNPKKIETRYSWISLYGADNVVEHCLLSGQNHSGVTLCVWLENGKSARHRILRNHFAKRPRGNGNGFETIRIGTSKRSMTAARCLVGENLFEECNGEIEIISNKSCENTYRGNTFRHCSGCLTLRHGNQCRVEGNLFIGGQTRGAGGVRVIGENHSVTNNFFSGTKGRGEGAISLQTGIPNSPLSGYSQVKNCRITGNLFRHNPGALFALAAGYGKKGCTLLPESVVIADNLMILSENAKPMIAAKTATPHIVWENNLLLASHLEHINIPGIRQLLEIPSEWKSKTTPRPLQPNEVGCQWKLPSGK